MLARYRAGRSGGFRTLCRRHAARYQNSTSARAADVAAANTTVAWDLSCTAKEDRNAGTHECGRSESNERMRALATERRERRGRGGEAKSEANCSSVDCVGDGVGSKKARKRAYVVADSRDARREAGATDDKVTIPVQGVPGSVHTSKGRRVFPFMRVLLNYSMQSGAPQIAVARFVSARPLLSPRLQTSRA